MEDGRTLTRIYDFDEGMGGYPEERTTNNVKPPFTSFLLVESTSQQLWLNSQDRNYLTPIDAFGVIRSSMDFANAWMWSRFDASNS